MTMHAEPRATYEQGAFDLECPHDLREQQRADRLASAIRWHWMARGHRVDVWIERGSYVPAMRCAPYYIRSNLKNGLPPKKEQN